MPLPPLSLDERSEVGARFAPLIPGIHALILDIVDDEGGGGDGAEGEWEEEGGEAEEEAEETDLARAVLKR